MKSNSKQITNTNDEYKNILGDHNRPNRIQIANSTQSSAVKSVVGDSENLISMKLDPSVALQKLANPKKAKSIQNVENELKKAVDNLRQKNEAQSRNNQGVSKMARANTAEKSNAARPRLASNEESTPKKEGITRHTRGSMPGSNNKSPVARTQPSMLTQELTKNSLNLSADADKLENSFSKSKIRTCTSSSKKMDKPQAVQTAEYNTRLSNVYAVKKMNFLKVSPLGKGKHSVDFSKGSSVKFTQEILREDDKPNPKTPTRKSLSSTHHSINPFVPNSTASKGDHGKASREGSCSAHQATRKSSIAAAQERLIILSSLVKLLSTKRQQLMRQAYSKLHTYLELINLKLSKFSMRRKKNSMRHCFLIWKNKLSLQEVSAANAIAYRDWMLLSKYFFKGWRNYVRQSKAARAIKAKQEKAAKVSPKKKKLSKLNSRNASVPSTNRMAKSTPKSSMVNSAVKDANIVSKPRSPIDSSAKGRQLKKKVVKKEIQEFHCDSEDLTGEMPRSYTPSVMEFNVKNQLEQSFGLESQSNPVFPEETEKNEAIAVAFSDEEDLLDQIETNIPQPVKHETIIKMSPTHIHSMRSMHIEELSNNTIVSRVSISKAMQSKDQSEFSIDISHPRNLLHEIKEKSLTVVPTSKENSLAVTKKKKKSVPRAEEKRESKTHSIERGSKAHSMERGIKTHPVEKNGTTYIINLNKALHFHRKKTIKNYGFLPWKQYIMKLKVRKSGNSKKSSEQNSLAKVSESNESILLAEKLKAAEEHYRRSLKMNVFNCFLKYYVDCFEQNKILAETREKYLRKTFFKKWVATIDQIKLEKSAVDHMQYDKIINKFRFIILTERALNAWKEYMQISHRDSFN